MRERLAYWLRDLADWLDPPHLYGFGDGPPEFLPLFDDFDTRTMTYKAHYNEELER